jgi:hypothetical protein
MSWCRAPLWGPWSDFTFSFCRKIALLLVLGRPLWREDGSVICSTICQWSELRRTHNHTLLSHLRLMGSITTRRDYGESIVTHLHTVITAWPYGCLSSTLPLSCPRPNGDRLCYAKRWLAGRQVARRLTLGVKLLCERFPQSLLKLSSQLQLCLPIGLFPSGFPQFRVFHLCYMPAVISSCFSNRNGKEMFL